MADYYVDSVSGNDTNLGTSWIEAFATLLKATATATANQEIFVSHVHNETPNVNVEYVLADNLIITSVNKTDDSYAFGALIDNSSDWYNITFNQSSNVSNVYKISGIHFKSGAYTQLKLSLSVIIFDRCEISQPSNSNTLINFNSTISLSVIFNKGTINLNHASSFINIIGNSSIDLIGTIITGPLVSKIFKISNTSGGVVNITNCDLSGVMSASGYILDYSTSWYGHSTLNMSRCKIDVNQIFTDSVKANPGAAADIYSCDNGDGYTYFYHERFSGEILFDKNNYLSATYDGVDGFSALLSSNTNNINSNLRHKLISIPAQDLTSTKTIKVNFTSDTTLTDQDFWLEVVRNDATDQALGVAQTTRPADILATGTTHTTNSESWTGGGTNKYEDSVTISGMTGVDNGLVEVWVNLALPSIDVWVDPAVVIT